MKRYFLIAVLLLLVCFTTGGVQAEEEVYGDWALHTSPESSVMVLEQRVFVKGEDKTPLIHLAVQNTTGDNVTGEKSRLLAVLRVPLGVLLQAGLQLKIDEEEPLTFAFHHCRANGCLVILPLLPELRNELETGKEARATFFTLNGQSVGVPLSLTGFKAGIAALEEEVKTEKKGGKSEKTD